MLLPANTPLTGQSPITGPWCIFKAFFRRRGQQRTCGDAPARQNKPDVKLMVSHCLLRMFPAEKKQNKTEKQAPELAFNPLTSVVGEN